MKKRNVMLMITGIASHTEKAVQVDYHDKELWFPRSQVTINGYDNRKGERVWNQCIMPYWLAEQNGLLVRAVNGNHIHDIYFVDDEIPAGGCLPKN